MEKKNEEKKAKHTNKSTVFWSVRSEFKFSSETLKLTKKDNVSSCKSGATPSTSKNWTVPGRTDAAEQEIKNDEAL